MHRGADAPHAGRQGALPALPAGRRDRRELRGGRGEPGGLRAGAARHLPRGEPQAVHHRGAGPADAVRRPGRRCWRGCGATRGRGGGSGRRPSAVSRRPSAVSRQAAVAGLVAAAISFFSTGTTSQHHHGDDGQPHGALRVQAAVHRRGVGHVGDPRAVHGGEARQEPREVPAQRVAEEPRAHQERRELLGRQGAHRREAHRQDVELAEGEDHDAQHDPPRRGRGPARRDAARDPGEQRGAGHREAEGDDDLGRDGGVLPDVGEPGPHPGEGAGQDDDRQRVRHQGEERRLEVDAEERLVDVPVHEQRHRIVQLLEERLEADRREDDDQDGEDRVPLAPVLPGERQSDDARHDAEAQVGDDDLGLPRVAEEVEHHHAERHRAEDQPGEPRDPVRRGPAAWPARRCRRPCCSAGTRAGR